MYFPRAYALITYIPGVCNPNDLPKHVMMPPFPYLPYPIITCIHTPLSLGCINFVSIHIESCICETCSVSTKKPHFSLKKDMIYVLAPSFFFHFTILAEKCLEFLLAWRNICFFLNLHLTINCLAKK